MRGPVIPTFLLTLAALILLILCTISLPLIRALYFLRAHEGDSIISFGMWGICTGSRCTPKTLGYKHDPEIIEWMTKVLVFYPIASGFTLITFFAILPAAFLGRHRDTIFPPPLYSLFVIPSAIASLIAFTFTIALFTVAKVRFSQQGFSASYGPLPWMSLAAMLILMGLMFFTGCGATWRGPFGEQSPYIQSRR